MNQRQARLARIRAKNVLKRYGKATFPYWQARVATSNTSLYPLMLKVLRELDAQKKKAPEGA